MSIHLPRKVSTELRDKLAGCNTEQEVENRITEVPEIEELLLYAVKKDWPWCLEHKALTERLIQKLDSKSEAVQKIQRNVDRLLRNEERRFQEALGMIERKRWNEFKDTLLGKSGFTEEHRFVFAQKLAENNQIELFILLSENLALSSCHDRTSIAIQFGTMDSSGMDGMMRIQEFFHNIEKFHMDEPEEAMRFAQTIAQNANCHNLICLTASIDCLPLSQDQMLEIAHLLAKREKGKSVLSECYPLQGVINNIENFELKEEDRIALSLQFMEMDPDGWLIVSFQMDKIAPDDAKAREDIARRFLEHPNESNLHSLVRDIEKFSLSNALLKEIYASVLQRKQLRDRAEKEGEKTSSCSAFAELLKQIRHFDLSENELRDLAFLAADSGNESELSALAKSIARFPLSAKERVRIALKIAKRLASGEVDTSIRFLCRSLNEFKLPVNEFEEEKFDLAMSMAKLCKDRSDIYPFMVRFEYLRLEREESRAKVAEALLKNNNSDCLFNVIYQFADFNLTPESTLRILQGIQDSAVVAEFLPLGEKLAKKYSILERLQLLMIFLGKMENQKIRKAIYFVSDIYVGDKSLVKESLIQGMRESTDLYEAIQRLGLEMKVLDLLPKLFPRELLDRFSELTGLVRGLIENTQEQNRQLVAHQLINVLLYLMLRNMRGELSDEELGSLSPLFSSLLKYRVPVDRLRFFFQAESLLTGEKGSAALPLWNQIQKEIKQELALIPSFVLLHQLNPSAISDEFNEILELFRTDSRFLRDNKNRNSLIDLIRQLNSYSVEEARSLFTALYQSKQYNTRRAYIQKIGDLLQLGRADLVKKIKELKDIDLQLEELVKEVFDLEEVQGFPQKYADTVGKFRQRNALLSYAIMIRAAFGTGSEQMAQLRRYFLSVLNGTFPEIRYEQEQSEHLKMLFEGREELEAKWKKGATLKPAELTSTLDVLESAVEPMDVYRFLYENIISHRHLGANQASKFPTLIRGLDPECKNWEELIHDLDSQIKAKKKGFKGLKREEKNKLSAEVNNLQLELGLLEISRLKLDKASLYTKLSALPKLPLKGTNFLGNILSLRPDTSGKKNVEEWIVVDTDDANDLLLMGTEIHGSCQRISGNAETNQCLIAYLVDGKNRLVAVKDEEGKLIGRAVLRMLLDEKNNPVLFREQLYVNHGNSQVEALIQALCIKRAKDLGLDLYCGDDKDSIGRLTSLGSPAPYEYVDASIETGIHVAANGKFVLDRAKPIPLEV